MLLSSNFLMKIAEKKKPFEYSVKSNVDSFGSCGCVCVRVQNRLGQHRMIMVPMKNYRMCQMICSAISLFFFLSSMTLPMNFGINLHREATNVLWCIVLYVREMIGASVNFHVACVSACRPKDDNFRIQNLEYAPISTR